MMLLVSLSILQEIIIDMFKSIIKAETDLHLWLIESTIY